MSWNNKDLTEIFQAVDTEYRTASGADGGGAMQAQIEAWSKMQDLFTWQHQNLTNHRKALAAKWSSGGGAAYLEQVDNVITTLSSAAGISYGNMVALSNMKQSLDKHYPIIKQAFEDYQKDFQQQLSDYTKKKQRYDRARSTALVRPDGAMRPPKEPDMGEITKPYLERARKAANTLSNDYASNNSLLLAYPPKYKGPEGNIKPDPPASSANALVVGGFAAAATAPFIASDPPHTGSGATSPTQVPPLGDPGPVLAGGPSAPVLPNNGPVISPPLSPSGGGGYPTSGLPIGAPIPPGGLGGGRLPTGGRLPGGLRDGVPSENEFLPRGRSSSPSVLGRNGSKFSVDRTARERYGLPREEPSGTSGRSASGRVLGQRTNKFAPKERSEPVSRRVIEPGEPISKPEPRSSVLGAEERTSPAARTRPPARPAVRDSKPDEAGGGRVLGRDSQRGDIEPAPGRRRPQREHGNNVDGDEMWTIDHEGDGVLAIEDSSETPTDSGPAIGRTTIEQPFTDWHGRG